MRVRLLGAAAGGGFPQWNCACARCEGVRRGTIAAARRTQASLAVSAGDDRWLLCGASPDVRFQIEATPALGPGREGTPLRAVALPNGDIDAWVGLLGLREWSPLAIYATTRVRRDLVEHNAALATLCRFEGHATWRDLTPGGRQLLDGGLTLEAVPVPGPAPLHLRAVRAADPLDNVALVVRAGARSIAWCPTVGAPSPDLARVIDEADVVFFDGTFWTDDELAAAGRGRARARDIGHWPLSGPEGSLTWLVQRRARRKVLVHINNTNPVLVDDGRERAIVEGFGIEVGYDGWELAS